MKRELLHMENLSIDDNRFGALRDVTFSLYEGETLLMTGLFQSGLITLTRLLEGELGPFQGKFRMQGNSCNHITHEMASRMGMAVIGQQSRLLPNLSFYENIQLLCGAGRRFGLLQALSPTPATDALIQTMRLDLDCPPKRPFDWIRREILADFAAGIRVLLFTGITAQCSSDELDLLSDTLQFLKQQGVALLLISVHDDLWCYSGIADRCLVMRKGMIAATLYKGMDGGFDSEQLHHLIVGRRFPPRATSLGDPEWPESDQPLYSLRWDVGETIALPAGRVIGLYDESSRIPPEIDHFLMSMQLELALCRSGRRLTPRTAADLAGEGVAVIPNAMADRMIFRNLSPVENVAWFARQRLGRRLYSQGIARYLFRDTVRRYSILRHCADLMEEPDCFGLGYQDLFGLTLAKWLSTNPELVVFFAPLSNEDIKMTERMRDLRQSLKQRGKAVLLISNDYEQLEGHCDELIIL